MLALIAASLATVDLAGTGDARWLVASQAIVVAVAVAVAIDLEGDAVWRVAVALVGAAAAMSGAWLGDAGPSVAPWLALEAAWGTLVVIGWWKRRPGAALLAALGAILAAAGALAGVFDIPSPVGSVVGARSALSIAFLAWLGIDLVARPFGRRKPDA